MLDSFSELDGRSVIVAFAKQCVPLGFEFLSTRKARHASGSLLINTDNWAGATTTLAGEQNDLVVGRVLVSRQDYYTYPLRIRELERAATL